MAKKQKPGDHQTLTKERVLDALAKNPSGTKRDIARALGIIGSERIALKRILKELEENGTISRGKKRSYAKAGAIPEVCVLEIIGQDNDGELLARPLEWDGEDVPPQIIVVPGRDDGPGSALGRGDRVLARLSETGNGYEAKIIKRLGASAHRVLGVFIQGERGGRIAPIDRKTKFEFIVDARDVGGAVQNELVLAEPLAGRSSGSPRARIIERLGSMDSPKTISLIAIHAHGIPNEFPKEVLDDAERARPVEPRGRTDCATTRLSP